MLSSEEENAVRQFLTAVNNARARVGGSAVTWCTALKFVTARKFDVNRALTLFEQHQRMRINEGLYDLQPDQEPLKSELASGKFTVLPVRDECGSPIAVFTARLHHPSTSSHRDTLQGLVLQLDVAMQSVDAQQNGLVFIYDMTGSKYSNFDYDLSQKILTMVKGAYPARLRKVLIVTAPLWFKAPFKILRLFVREKLRDRVWTVSVSQLSLHIPEAALPCQLGGRLSLDHNAWLQHCLASMSDCELLHCCETDLCDVTLAKYAVNGDVMCGEAVMACGDSTPGSPRHHSGASCTTEPNNVCNNDDDDAQLATSSGQCDNDQLVGIGGDGAVVTGGSESSGFSDDESLQVDDGHGVSVHQFVQQLTDKGREGLYAEYAHLKMMQPEGTFCNAMMSSSRSKNRYSDVLCLDHSRVVLGQHNDDPTSDYINANFVDGYKQRNAFISTQGPMPSTFGDFWRMVWQQRVLVLVMTTRLVEQGRVKCGRYWPSQQGEQCCHAGVSVLACKVTPRAGYVATCLRLSDSVTGQHRQVVHYLFTGWPDYNVPRSAGVMLRFLAAVRTTQARLVARMTPPWGGHPLGPPILVHCSAGIGRTGTFCTLDICTRRLMDAGTVDVQGAVVRVRRQRAHSIQVPDQYVFCHTALLEFAVQRALVSRQQLQSVPLMMELHQHQQPHDEDVEDHYILPQHQDDDEDQHQDDDFDDDFDDGDLAGDDDVTNE